MLAAIRYQPNRAVLHSDRALLPRDEKLWSAWNYAAGSGTPGEQPVAVSYLINRLQPLPFETPVVVTLNPAREPDPAKVIAEFDYAHPIFDGPAIAAQQRLRGHPGRQRHLAGGRLGQLRLPRGWPEVGTARRQWHGHPRPVAGRGRGTRPRTGERLRSPCLPVPAF